MSTPTKLVTAALLFGTLAIVIQNRDQTDSKECQEWNAQMDTIDCLAHDQMKEAAKIQKEHNCLMGLEERVSKRLPATTWVEIANCKTDPKESLKLYNDYRQTSAKQPKHCFRKNKSPR